NEVLDLARIESNQLVISLKDINANEIVGECVAMASALGERSGITIVDEFSRGPSVFLHADRVRLKQVIINLFSNAVKFNRDGGTVSVIGKEIDDGFFRISVTDTGIGITAEDCDSVFKMFHRLDVGPMIAREGTGIGLTVTKLLVERMGGRIGLESEFGIGSTFWIELRLGTAE
ncbi:MAG: HAMP domain-containing sensor histidine kinase, partial [Proteobacteria bacterium]|nr:HAMP domain-containing sensor histidine kinase [Pseudomonadota bacterium]